MVVNIDRSMLNSKSAFDYAVFQLNTMHNDVHLVYAIKVKTVYYVHIMNQLRVMSSIVYSCTPSRL